MTPSDVDDVWVNITEKLSWDLPGSCDEPGARNSPMDKTGDHSKCPGVLLNQFGPDLESRMYGETRSCPADLRKSERMHEIVYLRENTYVRILFDTRAEGRLGAK